MINTIKSYFYKKVSDSAFTSNALGLRVVGRLYIVEVFGKSLLIGVGNKFQILGFTFNCGDK